MPVRVRAFAWSALAPTMTTEGRLPRSHGWPEVTARKYLVLRSGGVCELCGAQRATEYSHRMPRNKVSGYCVCDAMHLCHDCHMDRVHGQPKAARMYGWVVSRHATRGVRFEPAWLPALDRWVRLTCVGTYENASDPNP